MKLLYLLFGFFTFFSYAQGNFVQINGSTNINKFQCINSKVRADAGVYSFSEKTLPNIILKVTDFDCGNNIMNRDFQKILVADKYPEMVIRFLSFTRNQKSFSAIVEVRMMNQSRKYNIEFGIENNRLVGRKNVKFSDFNITPPKKMGGMIVVKDDLDLIFSLTTKV